MNQYLIDTEFAMQNLFKLAWDEEKELELMHRRLKDKERELKVHQWDFQTSDLNEDFSEAYAMAAFARAGKAANEAELLRSDISTLSSSILNHQYSVQAISGAILQIAKQGISMVHGQRSEAPEGRSIGSVNLRDVVWQARNQSMHYEEGNFKPALIAVFLALEREKGLQFSLTSHKSQSLARQVLELLEWIDYQSYIEDIRTIIQ